MAKRIPRNFRLGTRSGLICVDIIQGSELSVCSCVQRKVPPVLFYTSTLEYFSTTTHTQIYGEFTHILLRNLEHTENSYRFFRSDLEFEKLILNFTRHLFKELCHAPGILTQICA